MKSLIAGGAYYGQFITSGITGAALDATGTPAVTATKNGTDDAAFVLTATKIDTGRYKITGTVPAGYANGDSVQVSISATVDGVAGIKEVVDEFVVVLATPGTSAEYQQFAREPYGVSGTVYHVKYAVAEDLTPNGLSWATAKLTAGPGLKTVIEAATAGDLVLLGAGTFALATAYIATPDGVSVRGAGMDVTTITSTYATAQYPILRTPNNGELSDLTVYGTLTNGSYQLPVGRMSDTVAGFVCRAVKAKADSDSFYFSVQSNGELIDCIGESLFDTFAFAASAGGTINATRCAFRATGPSNCAGGATARAIYVTYGTINLMDCCLVASGATTTVLGISVGFGATVRMFGGGVRTTGGTTTLDFAANAATIIAIGPEYNRTKTSAVSGGTITDVARVITDTSGRAYADMRAALGTTLTEAGGAGRLAAAISIWGNVATPAATAASVNQTGDSFARIGDGGVSLTAVPWNSAWASEVQTECTDALNAYDPPTNTEMVAAFTEVKGATWSSTTDTLEAIRDKASDIETDTQDLQLQVGTDGAGLTALPWNATWDAEVQSECNDALVALDLDHLINTAVSIPSVTAGTFLDQLMDDGTASFDRTTDSLQATRDHLATVTAKLPSKSYLTGTSNSDGDIQLNEATGALTGAALANAPTGTTASYTVSTATTGTAPVVNITQYQHAAFGPVAITATAAQTGDSHSFLVYDYSAPATVLWSLTTAGGEISVSGVGDVTVTIVGATGDPDQRTGTAGEYGYILRNTTDDTVICVGCLSIEAVPTA